MPPPRKRIKCSDRRGSESPTRVALFAISLALGCGVRTSAEHPPESPARAGLRRGGSLRLASGDAEQITAMDHVLARADFIGVVQVERILSPTPTLPDYQIDLRVEDPWFSRLPEDRLLRIGVNGSAWGHYRRMLQEKPRLLVMLSGGPWTESSFTYRHNSFFRVERDLTLRCNTENALYAINQSGIWCSNADHMVGAPVSLPALRAQVLDARTRVAERLRPLVTHLDRLRRPLLARASRPSEIDRTLAENEVVR